MSHPVLVAQICIPANNNSSTVAIMVYLSAVCGDTEWQCRSGQCVPLGSVCDTKEDCDDGLDEAKCCKYGALHHTVVTPPRNVVLLSTC